MKKISDQVQFWTNIITILVIASGVIGFVYDKKANDSVQDQKINALSERQDYLFNSLNQKVDFIMETVNKRFDSIERKMGE